MLGLLSPQRTTRPRARSSTGTATDEPCAPREYGVLLTPLPSSEEARSRSSGKCPLHSLPLAGDFLMNRSTSGQRRPVRQTLRAPHQPLHCERLEERTLLSATASAAGTGFGLVKVDPRS